NTLNYKKRINDLHSLDLLGGFSIQESKFSSQGMSVSNIPNEQLGMSGIDEGTPYEILASRSNNTIASYFARANYNFNSKYLFTVTFRGDGTSKFAPGKKWGYFPSGAFAWNITEEPF